MEFLSDSDEELNNCSMEIQNKKKYKSVKLSEFIKSKNMMEKSLCNDYRKIKITGEIKNLKHLYAKFSGAAFAWKFSVCCGIYKQDCIFKKPTTEILENKVYELYGSILPSKFNLQFEIDYINILENTVSQFEKLYTECNSRKYFDNKKQIVLENCKNILIISKQKTQGCVDFMEYIRKYNLFNLKISVKNVCLEGSDTSADIIKVLNKLDIGEYDIGIILRGGGDTTDISNSYDKLELFDAIKTCNIPIGTAIGHTQDKNNKLLITKISDIDFNTPTACANKIIISQTNYYKRLYESIYNKFRIYINSKITNIDEIFESYIEENREKSQDKLEELKEELLDSLIPNGLFLDEKPQFIYITENNVVCKYKLEPAGVVNISSELIEQIRELETIDDFELIKSNSVKINSKLSSSITRILNKINKLDTEDEYYNEINPLENIELSKYYGSLFPDIKSINSKNIKNAYKLKEILLSYVNEIESISANCESCNLVNENLERLEINETNNILEILRGLKYMISIQ